MEGWGWKAEGWKGKGKAEGWSGRLERKAGGRKTGRLEGWKVGRLEGWRLEGWKSGRLELEGWKVGRLEGLGVKGGSGYLNFRFKQIIYTTSVILGSGPPSTYLKSVTVGFRVPLRAPLGVSGLGFRV